MASCLPARLQDQFCLPFMESKLKPHRIFMRIDEPSYPGMEHCDLGLGPLPNFDQGGRLIDKLAAPKHRDQQIFKGRFQRHVLATGQIQRVNNGEWLRRPRFDIVDSVADEFPVRAKSPDLLDAGV